MYVMGGLCWVLVSVSWVGLGWVHKLVGWVGLGEENWTHVQLWRQCVGLDQRSCSTFSPVSSGMGDCRRAGKLSHYVINHPGQLSLAIPPWIGAMSTGDSYGHRYKRRVLRSISPCDQDCWYTDPSWLKALAVKLSRPSGQSGSYTGLIGFNHRPFKGDKSGNELQRNGPQCLCEIFFFFFLHLLWRRFALYSSCYLMLFLWID